MAHNETRPIVLYINRFEFQNINVDYLERKQFSIIDAEMDYVEAEKLIKYLQERVATQNKYPGGIRIRIHGNLVIT